MLRPGQWARTDRICRAAWACRSDITSGRCPRSHARRVIACVPCSAKDKAAVIKKAEKFKADEKDADSAKYYAKVMTKASADAEFVTKETARLKKMMDDGSVKADKKAQFGRRLNMLSSFE